MRSNVLYIAENHPFHMTIYKDSLRSSIIKGGPENELLFKYINNIKKFGEERVNLNTQYQIASKLKEADKSVNACHKNRKS